MQLSRTLIARGKTSAAAKRFLKCDYPKTVWEVPAKVPYRGGVISTAGDLVSTGARTGEFMAFDAANGKKLWQFQTGSGIAGLPITNKHKGKQYVVVTSGGHAAYGAGR